MKIPAILRSGRAAVLLAVVVAAAVLVANEAAYWRSNRWMETLDAATAARADLRGLRVSLQDAEWALRAYLLTGHAEQQQACRAALDASAQALARLAAHFGAGDAAARYAALAAAVHERREDVEHALALAAGGERERAINQTLADHGGTQTVTITQHAAALDAAAAARQDAARARVDHTLLANRIGIDALALASLAVLALYLRQARAIEELRARRAHEIEAERDRLEREVARRTAQLTRLTRYLQTAREDERARLARELHDELGALLTAAKLDAARLRARLGSREPEALERLAHLIETLNDGIALKRRIIEDLRPSSLDNLGLVAALEILAREFEHTAKLPVQCRLEDVRLAPAAQLTVYRLVQEAFTNIAKYARARRVELTLASRDGLATVEVADDGAGFDPEAQPQSAHGLLGMRYRVESEGGSLAIESAPARGTRIRASIPERPAA